MRSSLIKQSSSDRVNRIKLTRSLINWITPPIAVSKSIHISLGWKSDHFTISLVWCVGGWMDGRVLEELGLRLSPTQLSLAGVGAELGNISFQESPCRLFDYFE